MVVALNSSATTSPRSRSSYSAPLDELSNHETSAATSKTGIGNWESAVIFGLRSKPSELRSESIKSLIDQSVNWFEARPSSFEQEESHSDSRTYSASTTSNLAGGSQSLLRLGELRSLGTDWDSYGGSPPTLQAIAVAERFLRLTQHSFTTPMSWSIPEPTAVAARSDGGILIEWNGPAGVVELHIEPDGTTGYLHEDAVTGKYSETDSASWAQIQKQLGMIFAWSE